MAGAELSVDYRGEDGAPRVVVVGPAGRRVADAERAVTLAGGRIVSTFTFETAAAGLEAMAAQAIVTIETESVDDALLTAALPDLAARADAAALPIIVSLGRSQIDLVAANMAGPATQLLCEPSLAERVAAIAFATAQASYGPVHEAGRESEALRLQRLNEEVARIAEVLARLAREESTRPVYDPPLNERRMTFAAQPVTTETTATAVDVRRAIRARRMRDQFFGTGLFEDPAWDMLLDLFAADLERAQVSVSSLCIAAAVAPTTALRWIGKLSELKLLVRQPDPFDRRRAFMALSDTARAGMHAYFEAMRKAGLPIA